VAAVVPTIEEGVGTWRDAFGLDVEAEATVAQQGVRAVLLPCGDSEIELLQPLDPEGAIAGFMNRGGGIHHLCLQADDVGAELTRLGDAGVRCIDSVPRPGLAGRIGFLHPKATFGSLVELATPGGGVETQRYVEPHPVAEPPLRVERATHVTYCVEDLQAAREVFARNFGLDAEPAPGVRHEIGGEALRVHLENGAVDLAHPTVSGGWLERRLEDKGEGLAMLHVEVASLEPGLDALRALGFDMADLGDGTDRTVVLWGRHTNGIPVAVTEPRS